MNTTTLDTTTVRRWKRYPQYRPVGSDWLDTFPDGWLGLPLKRWVGIKITDGPHETPLLVDEGVDFVSAEAVADGRINFDARRGFITRELHEIYCRKCRPQRADIFMCKSGATTGKLAIVETDAEFSVWSPLAQIRADSRRVFPQYLFWALQADYVQNHIRRTWSAGTQPNISMGSLERLLVVAPIAVPQQRAIAAFLDRETARIDALIGHKEQLIALLEEKRQAVISHAVTRGLDTAVPLKDSGVPWLGMVPKHWRVMRVRHLLTGIEQGWSPEAENREADPDEWAVMRAGCVNRGYFDERDHKALPAGLSPIPALEIKPGDLLMSRACGSADLVGSVALVTHCRPKLMLCDKLYRLGVMHDRINASYLELLLKSSGVRYQIERDLGGADGLARNIGQGVVQELVVCVPTLSEQNRILENLIPEVGRFTAVSQRCRDGIAHLQEYRSALISAAVTGQIDVRGEVTS